MLPKKNDWKLLVGILCVSKENGRKIFTYASIIFDAFSFGITIRCGMAIKFQNEETRNVASLCCVQLITKCNVESCVELKMKMVQSVGTLHITATMNARFQYIETS